MPGKIKIFGKEIEWYDVKTKFKQLLRKILYSFLIQELICLIISFYMWFVYLTSRKKFINAQQSLLTVSENRSVIICFWHNRLMMIPFVAYYLRKNANKNYNFMTLASNHGDGKFVGRIMGKFGFKNIYGSSQQGRKASRGISLTDFRNMVKGLQKGGGLGITPDGPRGPNQKINSEIISIAKLANCVIIPISYSSSRFFAINSWDKFKFPLPFSKINFYFGDKIVIDKNISEEESEKMKIFLENKMNEVQDKSAQF